MAIPVVNPTDAVRDTAILANLTAVLGNATAAQNLLNTMPASLKAQSYIALRNAAIDTALQSIANLNTVKVAPTRFNISGYGPNSFTGIVNPIGTAQVVGAAGEGMVTVQITSTITVHADNIAGLVV